jgi:hypothetical protein
MSSTPSNMSDLIGPQADSFVSGIPAPADLPAGPPPTPPSLPPDTSGIGYTPADATSEAPSAPQPPSLWRQVLTGALQGLAAGASVNTRGMGKAGAFAAGAGAGVNRVMNEIPQQNAALDQAKLQTAFHYAQLSQITRQLNLMPDNKREAYLGDAADTYNSMLKSGAVVPMSQPSDVITAQQTLQQLHAKNPWATYSVMPVRGDDGTFQYSAVQFPAAPTQADVTIKGGGENGEDLTVPAGTPSNKIGQVYSNLISKKLEAETKSDLADKNNAAKSALADKNNAARSAIADKTIAAGQAKAALAATGVNVVAFDPDYANADGSNGANVVLDKATAQQRGLFSYKADPSTINSLAGGMNDVQNKLNSLADVVNDTQRMRQVDPTLAAAMLNPTTGVTLALGAHGGGVGGGGSVATDRINAWLNNANVKEANQATKDYVAAFIGAHEAITQLPRLQTFGKSSRMTETQLHAALNLLPQPGDTAGFAQQKMQNLQTMIDPLRKQIPHMQGAELIPSWLEQQQKAPSATHVFDPVQGVLKQLGVN